MRSNRSFFNIWFVFVFLMMLAGIFWQITLYDECKKDGHSAFFCMSATSKGQYVIIDEVEQTDEEDSSAAVIGVISQM